ncbi:unnamed protein product [Auanema sp. JU1783]|nr:unnamed protein product [Auanema sp. JU1783]
MTKRRPSNKKPTGLNKDLGTLLTNDREKNRRKHLSAKYGGQEIENAAFIEKEEKHYIDSITDETSLEEFLAKAQLAGTEFTAERQQYRVVENTTATVVPSRLDFKNNKELQDQHAHKLRIPRRPSKELWSTAEELTLQENEVFLKWRTDLAQLQEVDGLALTPFERNPDMWRELWRVVEKSDIIVQIVDARNPLLFRSLDLEAYVKEVDPAKQNVLLVNKSDLLKKEQIVKWNEYFVANNVNAVFWSALDTLPDIAEEHGDMDVDDESEEEVEANDPDKEDPEEVCSPSTSEEPILFVNNKDDLVALFKKIGHVRDEPGAPQLKVGMVGYPNVGKSSTINKIIGDKKVSVSATPGKTRHFQTIHLDKQVVLCDCPGLVMPSFTFGRQEMFLNGILPVDQMRDHFAPTALLLSRVPGSFFEKTYSIMLPEPENPSPHDLLTSLAFMRGFMSSSGIPDCSRAARIIMRDVVNGKLLWVAAPPHLDQIEFSDIIYGDSDDHTSNIGRVQLEQLEKRGILDGTRVKGHRVDNQFFTDKSANVHVKSSKLSSNVHTPAGTVVPTAFDPTDNGKKHFNRNKKEKARRLYVQTY